MQIVDFLVQGLLSDIVKAKAFTLNHVSLKHAGGPQYQGDSINLQSFHFKFNILFDITIFQYLGLS